MTKREEFKKLVIMALHPGCSYEGALEAEHYALLPSWELCLPITLGRIIRAIAIRHKEYSLRVWGNGGISINENTLIMWKYEGGTPRETVDDDQDIKTITALLELLKS